jgi:hypothetical protein
MIKSRGISWLRHVGRSERRGIRMRFWCESQKERDYWKDIVVISDNIKKTLLKWDGLL